MAQRLPKFWVSAISLVGVMLAVGIYFLMAPHPSPLDRDQQLQRVYAQASEFAEAMKSRDIDTMVRLTHPNLVKASGGERRLGGVYAQMFDDWVMRRVEFSKIQIDYPTQLAQSGDDFYAIVPSLMELRRPDGSGRMVSFLIGMSNDGGRNWTFLDGATLKESNVSQMLPNFPKEMKLPRPTVKLN